VYPSLQKSTEFCKFLHKSAESVHLSAEGCTSLQKFKISAISAEWHTSLQKFKISTEI
jgi:hypothetical protein